MSFNESEGKKSDSKTTPGGGEQFVPVNLKPGRVTGVGSVLHPEYLIDDELGFGEILEDLEGTIVWVMNKPKLSFMVTTLGQKLQK